MTVASAMSMELPLEDDGIPDIILPADDGGNRGNPLYYMSMCMCIILVYFYTHLVCTGHNITNYRNRMLA